MIMFNIKMGFLAGIVLLITLAACAGKGENLRFDPQDRIDDAVAKSIETLNTPWSADSLPRNILQGETRWNRVGIHDWTSGFWPGVLWYAYEASGRPDLLENARKYTEPLQGVLSIPVDNHDLGFMFFCSFGNGYRLTDNEAYRKVLLTAADSLATLFNPKVGSILSWPAMRAKMNWPHNTIIDNMMNLELLFWASKNGGGAHLADIAVKHAETTMRTLVRPDYSTFHVAVFDTTDGRFLKGVTHQGYADSSFWARGQAWGIYGFTMSYRESGKMPFLETAQKLADRFLTALPEDTIPFWDLSDPAIPDAPRDASAAAIAASALLELSTLVATEPDRQRYRQAAGKLLQALSTPKYHSGTQNQSLLNHSTGHKPNGSEIDASIIYADYYYLEALLRLKKLTN